MKRGTDTQDTTLDDSPEEAQARAARRWWCREHQRHPIAFDWSGCVESVVRFEERDQGPVVSSNGHQKRGRPPIPAEAVAKIEAAYLSVAGNGRSRTSVITELAATFELGRSTVARLTFSLSAEPPSAPVRSTRTSSKTRTATRAVSAQVRPNKERLTYTAVAL